MRDVTVGETADSVLSIDFFYEEGPKGGFTPVVRDVELLRVTSRKSKYGLYIRGFERATIDDIRINGCTFTGVKNGNIIEHATDVHFKDTVINGAIVANTQ